MRHVLAVILAVLGVAGLAFSGPELLAAPPRAPAVAPLPYLVKTAASLADLEKTLAGKGSHGADLVKPGPVALEVVWRHEEDNVQPDVELHDGKDHIFFVTDGRVVFTLGGEMEQPREVSAGEWRAPRSRGARVVEIKKGDLLFIPHGTVHARSTRGTGFTMLQLSFWPGGAPGAAVRP
jgi:mannose-6-phosphate isomerase-like protein (cupin superfamily)